ncbi:ATP-binding cassette domain-containing protein [Candidatus Neomarinimicrobiota bacterium]
MQQPLFSINNITAVAGKKTILSVANFEIHRGIVYSITGQTGSGKSAFLNALGNPRSIATGKIVFDGLEVGDKEFKTKFEEEIVYLPQIAVKASGTVEKYLLKNIKIANWSDDTQQQRIKSIANVMSLSEKLQRRMKTLSPGERRWIDLAVCLASDSKVLILDEIEQHTSYDELDLLKRQLSRKCNYEGTTIILSTLNLMNVRRLTGISVTFDRGHIAMIRSIREGGRGGGDGRRRSSERPRRNRGQQGGRDRKQAGGTAKVKDNTAAVEQNPKAGSTDSAGGNAPASPARKPRGRRPRKPQPKK